MIADNVIELEINNENVEALAADVEQVYSAKTYMHWPTLVCVCVCVDDATLVSVQVIRPKQRPRRATLRCATYVEEKGGARIDIGRHAMERIMTAMVGYGVMVIAGERNQTECTCMTRRSLYPIACISIYIYTYIKEKGETDKRRTL